MILKLRLPAAATVALALVAARPPRISAQQSRGVAAIHKEVRVVVFDLVVTDRDNRPITGLRARDFRIFDNGIPQKLLSFQLIARPSAGSTEMAAAPGSPERPNFLAIRAPNYVTLAFDQLGPAAARAARGAALDLVRNDLDPRDFASVCGFGLRATTLQPFTSDRAALSRAIALATSHSALRFAGLMPVSPMDSSVEGNSGPGVDSPTAGTGTDVSPRSPASQIAAFEAAMALHRKLIAAQSAARASTDGLLDVIHSLEDFPGRKAVFYFSQWLPEDEDTAVSLESAIREAKRARISIFVVDPSGLGWTRENSAATRALLQEARVSASQPSSNVPRAARALATPSPEQRREFDDVAEIFNQGPNRMRELASETGGEFVRDENDLAPVMRALSARLYEHYEMSWTPRQGFDGKYHTIAVQVDKPGVLLHARLGYNAVFGAARAETGPVVDSDQDPIYSLVESDFEAESGSRPARAGPLVRVFSRAAVLPPVAATPNDPSPTPECRVELLSRVPFAQLVQRSVGPNDLLADPALAGRRLLTLEVLQVVRDQQGNIIRAYRQGYRVAFPLSYAEDVQRGYLTYDHSVTLPPGRYRLQTAALQLASGREGLAGDDFVVAKPEPGKALLGDLILVAADQAAGPAHPISTPLEYGGRKLWPDPTGLVPANIDRKQAGFFLAARLPAGAPTARLDVRFERDGAVAASLAIALPPPAADGDIQYLLPIPASLAPGRYRAQVRLRAGELTATQSAAFTIQP